MKRDVFDGLKIEGLMEALDIPRYAAAGILTGLWKVTEKFYPRGDIGRASNRQIAERLGWPVRKADQLIAALIKTRWLDEVSGNERLYVHDWHEHCEDSTHRVLARKHLFFTNGCEPKLSKLEKEERQSIERFYESKRLTPDLGAHRGHSGCPTYTYTNTRANTNTGAQPDGARSAPVAEHAPPSGGSHFAVAEEGAQEPDRPGQRPSPTPEAPPRPDAVTGLTPDTDIDESTLPTKQQVGVFGCPLQPFPRLAKCYRTIRRCIEEVHPHDTHHPMGHSKEIEERFVLAALINENGFTERDVLDTLAWVLKEEPQDGPFSWRNTLRNIEGLRKRRDGAMKFTRMFEAMQAAKKPKKKAGRKLTFEDYQDIQAGITTEAALLAAGASR